MRLEIVDLAALDSRRVEDAVPAVHHVVVERKDHQRGIRHDPAELARVERPVLHRLPDPKLPEPRHYLVRRQRVQRGCHRHRAASPWPAVAPPGAGSTVAFPWVWRGPGGRSRFPRSATASGPCVNRAARPRRGAYTPVPAAQLAPLCRCETDHEVWPRLLSAGDTGPGAPVPLAALHHP